MSPSVCPTSWAASWRNLRRVAGYLQGEGAVDVLNGAFKDGGVHIAQALHLLHRHALVDQGLLRMGDFLSADLAEHLLELAPDLVHGVAGVQLFDDVLQPALPVFPVVDFA